MKIAVDGMGGDHAPGIIVEGVVWAAKELPHIEIVLIGLAGALDEVLVPYQPLPANITVKYATEVVGMDDPPATSVRRKRDSSIVVACELAKAGEVDAVVSAGNTGAVVCAATLSLRLLPGVERAGIAVTMPTLQSPLLLIDVGANIDTKPLHLLQYALMGEAYFRDIYKVQNAKIGLLNIGEEETKGTGFLKEANQLLSKSSLNFCGNVEGHDLFEGDYDIIVCDGVVGNVTLKVSESLAAAIGQLLKRTLSQSLPSRIGAFLSRKAFRVLKQEIDYAEYGGAPLLGVNGIAIIGHGSSSAKAVKNAIRLASQYVNQRVNQHIIEAISNAVKSD